MDATQMRSHKFIKLRAASKEISWQSIIIVIHYDLVIRPDAGHALMRHKSGNETSDAQVHPNDRYTPPPSSCGSLYGNSIH